VASENGETLALDLEISEDLLLAGLAREATRLIQEARKQAGLEITDRISVTWQASDEITQAALLAHGENIAREVLATAWQEGSVAKNALGESDLGLAVELNKN
jgi:isoleucyl-tRNA synthetase